MARSAQAGVSPPTTFGVVLTVKSVRPGSIRSGDIARWKSTPARRPLCSSTGASSSRVVPGYVVDSSTTSWSRCRCGAMAAAAAAMIETSGSRFSESGVGTQIRIARTSATAAGSALAVSMPDSTSGRRSSVETSGM